MLSSVRVRVGARVRIRVRMRVGARVRVRMRVRVGVRVRATATATATARVRVRVRVPNHLGVLFNSPHTFVRARVRGKPVVERLLWNVCCVLILYQRAIRTQYLRTREIYILCVPTLHLRSF